MAAVANAGNFLLAGFQSVTDLLELNLNSTDIADGRRSGEILPLHNMEANELTNRFARRTPSSNATGDRISIEMTRSLELNIENRNTQTETIGEAPTLVATTSKHRTKTEIAADKKRVQAEYEKCDIKSGSDVLIGIPLMTRFQSISDDMEMARMFKEGQLRILNHMQIEINDIFKRLSILDIKDSLDKFQEYRLCDTPKEPRVNRNDDQRPLLKELKDALKEYQETFLLNYKQISAMKPPQERNFKSLFTWMINMHPLTAGNMDIIYAKDDYISLADTHATYLEEQIQRAYNKSPLSWWKVLVRKKRHAEMNKDPGIQYYAKSSLSNLARMFSVCLVVGILLTPVFLLFLVPMARGLMALTASGFLILFAVVLTFMTESKLEVVCVGTATYGAVLIMFLGNINDGNLFVPS